MSGQTDSMILRLEKEVEERSSLIEGVVGAAQDAERDLTQNEQELTHEARKRIANIEQQLETLYESRTRTMQARERVGKVHQELSRLRTEVDNGPVEYRTAGAFLIDQYNASMGDREAVQRLEVFNRVAAHQKTSDNLGLIPDPIVGSVLNFIDSARPLVNLLGPRDMPSATWHRPKVTQHTTVAVQGSAGAAADEKSELTSQKMTITRVTGNAVTYGGYVNVSRQNIDFSSPQAMDAIVNDLASQYAVQTEAALGTVLVAATAETELATAAAGTPTATELTNALWSGVGSIYSATKGAGQIVLAVSPSKLSSWASVFAPVNPQNAQSAGFTAGNFGQGVMGYIAGIPVVMSSGIAGAGTDFGVLFSTAAVEVYEQRVGTLSVVEPSVLGVQVAYAGYFTPMVVESTGIRRIVNEA
jgi:HK97 family phage major capsid protein